jgi:ethanolamine utilization protein EutM
MIINLDSERNKIMVKKSQKNESLQSVGALDPEMRALGMIETRGLVACIEAADAMAKAANIALTQRRAIGGGYMTIMVRGDVGAVRTALEAGAKAAKLVGEVESVKMLPNPSLLVEDILPNIIA